MSSTQSNFLAGFGRRRKLRAEIAADRDRLYRIAWSWCHDVHLAEDMVQETMARALAKLDSLREESRLQVWLTQILANLFRDQYRRIKPETGLDTDTISGDDSPERAAEQTLLIARTREAIALLGEDQRQVLTLVDLAEFSYADTAAILDVPVGTVMSRLSRARRRMRDILQQQGIGDAAVIPLRKNR